MTGTRPGSSPGASAIGGRSAAVIGSFRQHYGAVLGAVEAFRAAGWHVTSPLGSGIVREGIPFVRFESDDAALDDNAVQALALHRILRADMTYVVAPDGYVGRTTCYEIGRLVQAARPVYFSNPPADLPLLVPSSHVLPAQEAAVLRADGVVPLHAAADGVAAGWERRLLTRDYLLS